MRLNRRFFMAQTGITAGALSALGSVGILPFDQSKRSLMELLLYNPQDEVDLSVNYLQTWEGQAESLQKSFQLITQTLPHLDLPKEGIVLEVGSYKGECLTKLCQLYGENRCLGIDIFNYQDHPRKITEDIRFYHKKQSLALGWNQTSTWSRNPRSKFAAHNYLKENLVENGFLIEDHRRWIPRGIDFSGFNLVLETQNHSIFQKKHS